MQQVILFGVFEANQTKIITSKEKISKYAYRKIYKWKTVSAEKSTISEDRAKVGIKF